MLLINPGVYRTEKTETYLIYSILTEGIWDNKAETSLSKTHICLTNDVYEYKAIGFETGGRQTMFQLVNS